MREHDDAGSGSPPRPRVHPQEGYLGRQREPLPTRVAGLPPLPPAYGLALSAGLAELGLELPADTRAAIDGHVRLLLRWNDAINLTAIREPGAIARLHVLDSLAAVEPLRTRGVHALVDLGSGGGFPGLPLALALPGEALLVDSVRKKVRFLEAVIDATGARGVRARADRAETLARDPANRETWPAVTARAVASLAELVELGFPLLRTGGVLIVWKRGDLGGELAAAHRAVRGLGGRDGDLAIEGPHLAALPDHRLVVVRKRAPTGPEWPRDPAARRRRPW